ncbi:MAG TPA: hypothetical protein VGP28_08240 [Methylocella sp.]|jgi:hypothetical protein|nr:hypothetical protein [Methylocella sp.]
MADLHLAPHRQKAFVRGIVGKLGVANTSPEELMNAPLVERREPRLEVQVRVVSGEPGAPMWLTRYFKLTERGLGGSTTRASSKPGH